MDDARIRSLIAELDNLVPRNGALIRPGEFFTETDEPAMVGNRLGYLRLGIELLKIADLPHNERIEAESIQSLIDPSDHAGVLGTFERREDLRLWREEEADRPKGWKDRVGPPISIGLGLLFVAALVLGLIKIACVVGRL